jgi:hypothetical protein
VWRKQRNEASVTGNFPFHTPAHSYRHSWSLNFFRLPAIRDKSNIVRILDQWCLLNVVMAGQVGGRGKVWETSFIHVNLHPHHKLPIDVWLSRIQDKIVASGAIDGGGKDPYGLQFLKLIKVPALVTNLSTDEHFELRNLTSAVGFDWTNDKLKELPTKYRVLLSQKGGLYKYFKFKN